MPAPPVAMAAPLVAKIQNAIATEDVQVLADAVAEAKTAMAELANWIQKGEDAMAKISPMTVTAVKKREDKKMANEWTFFFMNRDTFLNLPQLEGGVPRHQELRKEGKLFECWVSLEEVVTQRLARTSVVFSHRWFEPTHPDPENVKLLMAQEFVHAHPAVDAVWMDWLCVPQSHGGPPRTAEEDAYSLRHALQHQHVVPWAAGCALSSCRSVGERIVCLVQCCVFLVLCCVLVRD